jgi:hypothetical protein
VEKLRSAREGALRISRNLIRCCLLWGRKRPGSRLCPRACFSWGRRSSVFQLGKGATSILSVWRRITSRLRLIGSAWRRLIVRFLPASPARVFRAWIGPAERLLPADQRPWHQRSGTQGEEYAYFRPSRLGGVMVARNFRSPGRRGGIRSDRPGRKCSLFYCD